ncbi:MAG: Ig-like domain-containing protein, partial [Tannerella sp.]|nr:Ig-like domain-containing protein [Tannerella sp.]
MRTIHPKNLIFVLIIALLPIMVSCSDDDEAVMVEISLDQDLVSLVLDSSLTLNATVTPSNISFSEIIWTSTNPEVVTVSNGIIQAIGVGRAVINAKVGLASSFCDIIVTPEPVDVSSVTLNLTELDLKVGDQQTLKATIEPVEATDKRIRWSSSHPEIVSVDEKTGALTAIRLGEAVITVRSLNAGKTATCKVSVLSVLELLAPADLAQITPDVIDSEDKVTFTWAEIQGVETYTLQINNVPEFDEEPLYLLNVEGTSFDVASYELNELVKSGENSPVSLYWTVKPKSDDIRIFSISRTLNFVPDRNEYLLLNKESSSGASIEKMEGVYQYTLTTTGRSFVNTAALKEAADVNFVVVSFMYKSTQVSNAFNINFMSGNQVKVSVQETIPSSAEWKEMRIIFDQSIFNDWGMAGDYLQFSFGNDVGYKIALNGIHFTSMSYDEEKDRYSPEIFKFASWSGHVSVTNDTNEYFGFVTTDRDPNANIAGITKPIPPGAVLLSFEYRSNMLLGSNLQVFIGLKNGPGLSEARSKKFGTIPASASWQVYTAD